MSEYYEEGGLLYERSPPMHIKVESPEGAFGGRASEDGFPRKDDDSEGSCDRAGLPFNVVVVHPNVVAPGGASEQLLPLQQNRGLLPTALASGGMGKRKSRFSGAELEVLVSEVTRFEGELFGPAGRLRRRERERIWAAILERVNAVSRVPRTMREVKKRWDDLKRRSGGKLADARFRSWIPSGRAGAVLPGPAQLSPRFQATPSKIRSRGMPAFSCLSDTDPVSGDGSERDCFEREDESQEQEEDGPLSEGVDNSVDEKLGLALGLGIIPAPPSERWLPPSPLYSGPFLNGTPQQSPVPSLGPQQGPLPAPPSHASSWLDDELRGLGEAVVRLGERLEQNLRDFGEGFRRDMRTLVASQEALTVSIQQNNVLLQRLLSLLEVQVQPPPPPPPTQHPHLPPHRLQNGSDGITTAAPTSLPLPPDILDGTSRPESRSEMNSAGLSRGRTEHRRKRRH